MFRWNGLRLKCKIRLYNRKIKHVQGLQGSKVFTNSHVDVRRLEASLVDVVEGEGLSGVGAVLVHLYSHPAASLSVWLSLWMLPPHSHDFWQGEGHFLCDQSRGTWGEQCVSCFLLVASGCVCLSRRCWEVSWIHSAHSHSDLRSEHHLPPRPFFLLYSSSTAAGTQKSRDDMSCMR